MTKNIREQKIVNDILFHLDGWITNDHPPETRKIKPFLNPEEARTTNNTRKEVSTKEVLTSYEKAKIHALNYIRRKEFPNSPDIHQAICYWAAGLLSEKAHFKEEKITQSTLLIEEARRMLSPYKLKGEDFFTVSGDDFFWEQYMKSESVPRPRRNRVPPRPPKKNDPWGGEEKERLTHGHFHKRIPPRPPYNPCKPVKDDDGVRDWIGDGYGNNYNIRVDPIISDEDGLVRIHAHVSHQGHPCDTGKLVFYVYEDE